MGAGFTEVRDYHMKRGFYQAKDSDPKTNQPVWCVIEPLHGCEDERFFYVKKLESGKYHFEGEGYFFYRPEHLTQHLKELREELEGVIIRYYFIDDEGWVIKTEISDKPVTGVRKNGG